MWLKVIILIFYLKYKLIYCYTYEIRLFNLYFNYLNYQINVLYDPLLNSRKILLEKEIRRNNINNLNNISIIENYLKEEYRNQLKQRILNQRNQRKFENLNEWLVLCDFKTKQYYQQIQKIQKSISNILEKKNIQESSNYLLQELKFSLQYNVFRFQDLQDINTILFNKENYDLSLLISKFLFDQYEKNDIQVNDLLQLIVLSNMISLSANLVGNIKLATYTSLQTQYLYEYFHLIPTSNHHFTSSVNGIIAIHRLRSLLLVPPLPISTLTSEKSLIQYRIEMENDLKKFIQDMQFQNITVNLIVL